MAKYRIPVTIETEASHTIGEVECDSLEEFYEKAEALWESQSWDSPSTNITNDFDLGEWEIWDGLREGDLDIYEIKE